MDYNNDGKIDLIAGDSQGNVSLFLNTGTREKPELAKAKLLVADGKPLKSGSHKLARVYSKIHMADWDGDGLKDLLVGHVDTIVLYKNTGTQSEPRFQAPVRIEIPEGNFPDRSSPYVVDWDGDGKKDLLTGSDEGKVRFYRNVGTNTKPKLARGEVLDLKGPDFDKSSRGRLDVTDWNNDEKMDLLVGDFYSGKGRKLGGNIWLFLGK